MLKCEREFKRQGKKNWQKRSELQGEGKVLNIQVKLEIDV